MESGYSASIRRNLAGRRGLLRKQRNPSSRFRGFQPGPRRVLSKLHRSNSLHRRSSSNCCGPGSVITGPINGTTNSNKLAVLRPYVGYGPGLFFVDTFTSNYHSLQTQLQKRLLWQLHGQHFLHLVARPDYRSCRPQHRRRRTSPGHRRLRGNYGPTIADRRHVLTANFVWEIPWARNLHRVERDTCLAAGSSPVSKRFRRVCL